METPLVKEVLSYRHGNTIRVTDDIATTGDNHHLDTLICSHNKLHYLIVIINWNQHLRCKLVAYCEALALTQQKKSATSALLFSVFMCKINVWVNIVF